MTVPPGDGDRQKSLLVIGGSGRSGTSLLAGLAYRLGYHIPQPELKANETNPRGFGEPRWAIAFHKELLQSVDVNHDDGRPQAWVDTARVKDRKATRHRLRTWLDEQFGHSDNVVVKDPRLAWFVGLYSDVAEELSADFGVVTMLRHPAETVRSKGVAYGSAVPTITRVCGWLNMMLHVEERSRVSARALVRYEDLLGRWQPTLAAAEKALPLDLIAGRSEEELAAADALVDPQLRRTERSWEGLDVPEPLCELAERAYAALEAGAIDVDRAAVAGSAAELDELRAEYVILYGQAETMVRSSLNAARAKERRKVLKQIKNEQDNRQDASDASGRPPESTKLDGDADRRASRSPRQVAAGLRSRTTRLLSRRP